jgi:hypothetical protein
MIGRGGSCLIIGRFVRVLGSYQAKYKLHGTYTVYIALFMLVYGEFRARMVKYFKSSCYISCFAVQSTLI